MVRFKRGRAVRIKGGRVVRVKSWVMGVEGRILLARVERILGHITDQLGERQTLLKQKEPLGKPGNPIILS